MPLSKAESQHEYDRDEIERLKADNARAQDTIDRNNERLEYLDKHIGDTVKKLVVEHPTVKNEIDVDSLPKSAREVDIKGKPRTTSLTTPPGSPEASPSEAKKRSRKSDSSRRKRSTDTNTSTRARKSDSLAKASSPKRARKS